MSTTKQGERDKDRNRDREKERQEDDRQKILIGERVMQVLGKPGDLQQIQVRPLWEGRCRVNVLVGENIACARVAHSFFLAIDPGGNIVGSEPAIAKQY